MILCRICKKNKIADFEKICDSCMDKERENAEKDFFGEEEWLDNE